MTLEQIALTPLAAQMRRRRPESRLVRALFCSLTPPACKQSAILHFHSWASFLSQGRFAFDALARDGYYNNMYPGNACAPSAHFVPITLHFLFITLPSLLVHAMMTHNL